MISHIIACDLVIFKIKYSSVNLPLLSNFRISGGSVSNALGSIAVVYSSLYLLMNQIYEEENEAKSCVTGALTGIKVYK